MSEPNYAHHDFTIGGYRSEEAPDNQCVWRVDGTSPYCGARRDQHDAVLAARRGGSWLAQPVLSGLDAVRIVDDAFERAVLSGALDAFNAGTVRELRRALRLAATPAPPAEAPDPRSETDLRAALDAAVDAVLAYGAAPPEYPGLALVPQPDIERLRRIRTAVRVSTHSPHDRAGDPVDGFPVCSVCGAIQTSALRSDPPTSDPVEPAP